MLQTPNVPRVQKRALVWLSLTCLDEYLEGFRREEERLIWRFLVGVSLGISGAFDSTRFSRKAFPELFLFSLSNKSIFVKPYNNHPKPLNSMDLKGWLIGIPVFSDVYFPFPDRDRIPIKKWKFSNDRLNDDYCFFF
jgi:hypothetical protein